MSLRYLFAMEMHCMGPRRPLGRALPAETSPHLMWLKFLNLLTEKLDTYLKFNSIIDTRMTNLNDTLRTVSDKRIALEGRIQKLTERYALQYSSMESTIAQFQETGNMLTSMLETKKD